MQIDPKSHLDHGLIAEQVAHIRARFADRAGFFIESFTIPGPALPCALYGPVMGDAPIADSQVEWRPRAGRQYPSRILIGARPRPTQTCTVIAGPHGDLPCVLYTAFGGPPATRELNDPTLTSPPEIRGSQQFWAVHALAL